MNRATRIACTVAGNLGLLTCGGLLLGWGLELGSWALMILGAFFVACVARDLPKAPRRGPSLRHSSGEEVSGRLASAGPSQPDTRPADRSLHHVHQ